jgi:hypothetical protein
VSAPERPAPFAPPLALPLILLSGCALSHAAPDPPPEGTLGLELVDERGEAVRAVREGEVLDRGATVRFVVDVQRGDYLHLLQRNGRGVSALYPSTGLVWMRPEGVEHLVPQPPYLRDEERQLGFNGEDDGEAEYLLVAAPAPRPVPADGWLDALPTFLAGPPYVQGPAAADAVVVDRFRVVWGAEVADPDPPREAEGADSGAPEEGGGDEEAPPEEGGGEEEAPPEVGGEEEGAAPHSEPAQR